MFQRRTGGSQGDGNVLHGKCMSRLAAVYAASCLTLPLAKEHTHHFCCQNSNLKASHFDSP